MHQIDEKLVYSKIGMALISAQRVEFITKQLVLHLVEFDKNVYGLTSEDFLDASKRKSNPKMTLGNIFRLLELNPKLVIEDELDDYLKKRNMLVHGFLENYLNKKSVECAKRTIEFCNDFGRQSVRIESFFKGFIFLLMLRHVKDRTNVDISVRDWNKDFDYFMTSLQEKRLK